MCEADATVSELLALLGPQHSSASLCQCSCEPGCAYCAWRMGPVVCLMQTPQVVWAGSNLLMQGLFFPILMTLGRREPAGYLADGACSLIIYSQYFVTTQ